jgi:hypothetical protein
MRINYLINKYHLRRDKQVNRKITYITDEQYDPEFLIVQKEYPDIIVGNKIKSSLRSDLLIISVNNNNGVELAKSINKLVNHVDLFIIRLPKQFDFNGFIKHSNYGHVDIYHKRGVNSYYIVIEN